MADGNGFATDGMASPPAVDYTEFVIGGQKFRVRPIMLFDMLECKDAILNLGPAQSRIDNSRDIIGIVAFLTSPDGTPREIVHEKTQVLLKVCRGNELLGLTTSMNNLLTVSGIGDEPGEAEAGASPGTGTSAGSLPNSPPAESAEETPLASGEP